MLTCLVDQETCWKSHRFTNSEVGPADHGGGLTWSEEGYIDPILLSLVEHPATFLPRMTAFQSPRASFEREVSLQPHRLVPNAEFPSHAPRSAVFDFDINSYSEHCHENEFPSPGVNSFSFDTTTPLDRTVPPPPFNSCSPTISQDENASPFSISPASHYNSSPSSSPRSTSLYSPTPSSSSPKTIIPCTWPNCPKSFPSITSYK
jgi:hypothetical protein